MPSRWRREDVHLGMIVTRDDIEKEGALLYKVLAICDEPTVVVIPLDERDGEDAEHYVISAPDFAEFHRVRAADEPGSFDIVYLVR